MNNSYEEVKLSKAKDYLLSCRCFRTSKGVYYGKAFHKGDGNTFIRKGCRYDVVDGSVHKDKKRMGRINSVDVLSIAPNDAGLWVLRQGGVIDVYEWTSSRMAQLEAHKRNRELFVFGGYVGTINYMDAPTLANMMNTVGLDKWSASEEGKELSALGWGRDRVTITSIFKT